MVTLKNVVAVHTHTHTHTHTQVNLTNNKKDTLSAFKKDKYETDQ